MRAVLAGFVLLVPILASSQPRIQKVEHSSVAVSVISRELIEREGMPNVEVLLRGQPLGVTNATGELSIRGVSVTPRSGGPAGAILTLRGGESLIQLPESLRDNPLFAAYARPTETDGAAVILMDSMDELAFTLGDRPHAIVDEPVDWSCPSVAFTYDADANALDAEPSGCSEPAVLELSCPVSLRAGETGAFEARISGSYDLSVDWSVRDAYGADLDVEYASDVTETNATISHIDATWNSFNRAMEAEREAVVVASLGDAEEECRVLIESLDSLTPGGGLDDETGPSARILIGYNFEFRSVSAEVGGTAPIPIGAPLYGDVALGYFSEGGVGYGLLQAELMCRMAMTPLVTLFYGGGLHLLRSSSSGNSNIEVGPGVSGRIQYDGGWPIEPTAEVSASYHFERVIPTVSVGATYRFNQ